MIYLPPGVIPPAASVPQGMAPSGIPFDRAFFEKLLPQAVQVFCNSVGCHVPRVEVYTMDGSTHFVNGISGVTDTFVALQTSREEHDHPMQVFVPYQTIFRVEIHPESDDGRRKLGFTLGADTAPAIQLAAPSVEESPVPALAPDPKATTQPRLREQKGKRRSREA